MELLTEKEKRVLESFFKLGQTTVQVVAKDTLINRTALYHTIDCLIKKGLLTKIEKDKVSYFQSISIENYERWAKLKVDSIKNDIESDIKRFEQVQSKTKISLYADVKYFEGKEAIKNLYSDTLYNNKGKTLFNITDYEVGYKTLEDKWLENDYLAERVKRGIHVKNIVPDTPFARTYASTAKQLLRDICFVDLLKNSGIEINLYDNKIAIVAFDKTHPLGIIIQNELISKAFREIFNYIWKVNNKKK